MLFQRLFNLQEPYTGVCTCQHEESVVSRDPFLLVLVLVLLLLLLLLLRLKVTPIPSPIMVFRYDHHSTTARPRDNDHRPKSRWVLPFLLLALMVISEVVIFVGHRLVVLEQRQVQISLVQPFQDIREEEQEPKQKTTSRSVVQEPRRAPQAVSIMQTNKTRTAKTPDKQSNMDQYEYHQIDPHNNNTTHESFNIRQQEQTDEENLNGTKTNNNTSSWSPSPPPSSDSYFSARNREVFSTFFNSWKGQPTEPTTPRECCDTRMMALPPVAFHRSDVLWCDRGACRLGPTKSSQVLE